MTRKILSTTCLLGLTNAGSRDDGFQVQGSLIPSSATSHPAFTETISAFTAYNQGDFIVWVKSSLEVKELDLYNKQGKADCDLKSSSIEKGAFWVCSAPEVTGIVTFTAEVTYPERKSRVYKAVTVEILERTEVIPQVGENLWEDGPFAEQGATLVDESVKRTKTVTGFSFQLDAMPAQSSCVVTSADEDGTFLSLYRAENGLAALNVKVPVNDRVTVVYVVCRNSLNAVVKKVFFELATVDE